MDCARVMRGISSMAKAETPAFAMAARSFSLPYGSMIATMIAPFLHLAASSALGRRTQSTISAPFNVASLPLAIVAPASLNSSSETAELEPAPDWTTTLAPSAMNFFTVSAEAATRGSILPSSAGMAMVKLMVTSPDGLADYNWNVAGRTGSRLVRREAPCPTAR